MVYVSPSFLVKKLKVGHRLVTAFKDLGQCSRILPTASMSCNNVLRHIFLGNISSNPISQRVSFQLMLLKTPSHTLVLLTPFKGILVYLRLEMGMSGSLEYLQELTSLVFGDFLQESFMAVIREDINIFGTTTDELFHNWHRIPQQIQLNNLHLSTTKIAISLLQTTILAWIW